MEAGLLLDRGEFHIFLVETRIAGGRERDAAMVMPLPTWSVFRHGSQAPRTAWGQVFGGAIPPAVPGACEPCQVLSPRNSSKSLPFWQFPFGSRFPVAGSRRCR